MDGIEFFNKELKRITFPYFLGSQRSQQLAWRLTGFEGWMKGKYGFKDAVQNLLPARFKKVNVTTIDSLVDTLKIPRVDFLKMDVEGYEKRILVGAKNTIQRFSPVMSMSAYHHPSDKKELPAFIQSIASDYKYKIYMENEEDIVFWK